MKTWPKMFVACDSVPVGTASVATRVARPVATRDASPLATRVAGPVAWRGAMLVAALVAACGQAAEPQVETSPPAPTSILAVTDAWARAADSGALTAVYFTVENTAVVPDTLTAVSTDAAEEAGLHMSMEMEGMMHMALLRALPVPAQDSLLFRPLGAHVMLTRLTRPLVEGDTVRVTLEFVSGKLIEVRARVRKP